MKKEMKVMKDLRQDNVNSFIGAVVNIPDFILVTEYCSRGSLQDVLENDDITLDSMFVASLVFDLIKGMIFLHDSELGCHGNLKSSNCVVNSRWSLQVSDYGLSELRLKNQTKEEHAAFRDQLWTAPEILRMNLAHKKPSVKGDVYAFGIILYEILGRAGPFGDTDLSPKEIILRVKSNPILPDRGFRPDLNSLDCQDYVLNTMRECWHEIPDIRPDFRSIRNRLKPMRQGMKTNIMDNMVEMMERYQTQLEDLVAERTEQLLEEQKKTERLLHRMLPKSVADQLVRGEAVVPEAFPAVTIYFSDICGFTAISALSTPMEVVDLLNDLYTLFDSIIRNYDVYKVETIGDAYMVVSGLPIRNGDLHCGEIASMSLHLLTAIKTFRIRHRPDDTLKLRIGMHSGPTVAGVVGLTMPRYCLFGDTVNCASRMESNGQPLRIHLSVEAVEILDKLGGYTVEPRGLVSLKGKGEAFTFWLIDEDKSVRKERVRAAAALKCHGDTTQKQCCIISEHRPLVHSASVDIPVAYGSGDSLGSKRKLSKDHEPQRRLSPEGGFFEIFKESDIPHHRGSLRSSFHRRRSLDSRPRSREVSREVVNANGCIANLSSSGSHHRGQSLNEKCHPVRSKNQLQGGSQKEMTCLPSIVVDSHQTEPELYNETDCLLDSGLCSEHSTKETSPDDLHVSSTIPNSREMKDYKNGDKINNDECSVKVAETSMALPI